MADGRVDPPNNGGVRDILSFEAWQQELAASRARTSTLRASRDLQTLDDGDELLVVNELALTYEELSVAEEELRTQNEELGRALDLLAAERLRYRDLFLHATVAYFVTDVHGTIREANRAAAR